MPIRKNKFNFETVNEFFSPSIFGDRYIKIGADGSRFDGGRLTGTEAFSFLSDDTGSGNVDGVDSGRGAGAVIGNSFYISDPRAFDFENSGGDPKDMPGGKLGLKSAVFAAGFHASVDVWVIGYTDGVETFRQEFTVGPERTKVQFGAGGLDYVYIAANVSTLGPDLPFDPPGAGSWEFFPLVIDNIRTTMTTADPLL